MARMLTVLVPVLLAACVKKSEYDALQQENQQLQARVDQTSLQLQQAQTDVTVLLARNQQLVEVQAQLQKTQQQLQQSQDELKTLKAEFEKFRTQRRSAMVGKKYPMLTLDGGKTLREAQITAISASEVSIRHEAGLVKIALANTSDDLRWEACYDPQEAKHAAREQMLAEARRLDATLARERSSPAVTAPAATATNAVTVLSAQLAAQRQQLNAEYQALAAKNPGVLQGTNWNAARPEASPLLNSVSGSRAVLGISRLQSQRDAIIQTLQQLRGIDPAAR